MVGVLLPLPQIPAAFYKNLLLGQPPKKGARTYANS